MGCESGNGVGEEATEESVVQVNPPAEGFNEENSDPEAIAIADKVMEAQGGRKNWDKTRFIGWNFFGRRHLLWDKKTGNVRITTIPDSSIYLVNIFDDSGAVYQDGTIASEKDTFQKYQERAKSIWINDAYWLVMPFKLKDSGVTLKYLGQDTTSNGAMANKLQLTFEGVGRTPENKYLVYVDTSSNLVTQWDYYGNAADEKPVISTPWEDYKKYGDILLSGGRGGNRMLTDIAVYEALPESVFTKFDQIDLE